MTGTTAGQAGRSDIGADGQVPEELVAAYREYGFVRVRGVLDPNQVEPFRVSAEAFLTAHRAESLEKQGAFTQLVNVWQRDDTLRALTFDSRLGRIAEQLAGFPLRLWHDQMLVKEPHNNVATEFHQDRPYWPHAGDRLPLSAWIALVDVPPERGCMTFLPGTQHRTGLRPQDLHHEDDLFALDPSLRWIPRITVPLRAGDRLAFKQGTRTVRATVTAAARPSAADLDVVLSGRTLDARGLRPVSPRVATSRWTEPLP